MKLDDLVAEYEEITSLVQQTKEIVRPSTPKFYHIVNNLRTTAKATIGLSKLDKAHKQLRAVKLYIDYINKYNEFRQQECNGNGYSDILDSGGNEEFLSRYNLTSADKVLISQVGYCGFYVYKAVERFKAQKNL